MKNKFGFILVKPQLGENIGACARILKNFGFSKLILTQPRDGWPNKKADATSVGAIDIINKCKIYNNLEEAISKYNIIFSFSARQRFISKKHINLSKFIDILKKKSGLKVALMFGSEASGLTNSDISYSNYVVKVPTNSKFRSLNLSHSLAIVCYEIFKFLNTRTKKTDIKGKYIYKKDMINFLRILTSKLNKKNFFKPIEKRTSMISNINHLFYKFELNDKEIRILTSIISSLSSNNFKKHN